MKRTRKTVKPTKIVKPTKKVQKDTDIVYTEKQLQQIMIDKPKWEHFCREYCSNAWNKTQAYRAAYDPEGVKGLSDNTCASRGHDLARKSKIQQYIQLLKKDTESLTGVSKEKNLRELAKVAYSSISHLHDSWVDIKEYEDLTPDQLAAVKETDCKTYHTPNGAEVTQIKIILHPKLQAIETINKMMGYNATENVKVDQTTTHNIDTTKYTDEEKEFIVNLIRNKR